MKKIEIIQLAFIILLFFSSWWFWGREPYIILAGGFSDPGLVYVEPKWNGWDRGALIFKKEIPSEFREAYLDAEGWWYVKRQISDIPENLIKLEESMEKNLEKLEKYYTWKPLGLIR